MRRIPRWLSAAWGLLILLVCGSANAKTSQEVHYTLTQVYSGALRYLRIDLGCEITERDPETAYLLFRYQAPGKTESSFGAIEIVKTESHVRLVVKLPKLPSYHETVLRDGLLGKLREDYGSHRKAPQRGKEDQDESDSSKEKPEKPAPERGSSGQ